jgi:hypothetical protein
VLAIGTDRFVVSDAESRHSEIGRLKSSYGLAEKTTKSKNLETQTPQADERKPPQEAFAL